jgi:beta-glucosidase
MRVGLRAAALAAGVALAALSGGLSSAGDAKSAPAAAAPNVPKPMADAAYWNASLPTEQRVADLLGRMTLAEKIAQITALWENKTEVQRADYTFDPAKASQTHPDGIGTISRPSDHKGPGSPRLDPPRSIEESVAYVNAVQTWARQHTRLGIPVMFHEEALHGINPGRDGTAYPQAIGLASTWDPDLLRAVNAEIAGEIRPRGVQQVLSPVVDVARDPRWGRIEETFGEDPFLVGELGVAAVEGLQGAGTGHKLPPGKVFATLKHMTGHGQPESGTNTGPAPIGERTLREFFFPPFEQVVKRTGIEAVMASYNEIDGIPSH